MGAAAVTSGVPPFGFPIKDEAFRRLHTDLQTLTQRVVQLASVLEKPVARKPGDKAWEIVQKSSVALCIALAGWGIRLEIRVAALENSRDGAAISRMERTLERVADQTLAIDKRLTRVETLVAK